jgi:hypothetical protein
VHERFVHTPESMRNVLIPRCLIKEKADKILSTCGCAYLALSVCISDAHISQSDQYRMEHYTIYDDEYQLFHQMEKATSFLTLSYAPMLFRIFISLFL